MVDAKIGRIIEMSQGMYEQPQDSSNIGKVKVTQSKELEHHLIEHSPAIIYFLLVGDLGLIFCLLFIILFGRMY